ncbi:cytochrome c-type biogenesis protein CcmF [Desulfitispora alkaliphila]|uniref:heme lyase CcmF/NrfE family subunit n=1 Tax=Desulfitispora alkaliphila TaxID=622674 RepID=UPI003D1F602C
MLPEIGSIALMIALAISIYVIVAYLIGANTKNNKLLESAKGGVGAVALLTGSASAILFYSLYTSDFSVQYVARYTSTDLPLFYKLAAFWAGNSGSLLLWQLILTIYAAVVAYSKKHHLAKMTPYVVSILMLNVVFFFFMLNFVDNPFTRIPNPPAEGNGLNPMLQHPGMVFHPLTLFLGYVGFAVPFAYAMAALYLRRVDDAWIKVTRRWTVFAWLFLTLGNLYGGQWAYVELGWGGYWAWDPVENASFMPWLTGTAFLHSVMIQERKDMLKIWNVGLIITTYCLTLFGTFLVRSGVLSSVHSFADSNIGVFFLFFLLLMLLGAIYNVLNRTDVLKQESEFQSVVSKESSFLINNLLLVGSAFAVFWGTIFPVVSEAATGVKITVGEPFFNQVNGPILLAMLLVMGICPLIAWQKSTLENLRNNFLLPMVTSLVIGIGLFFYGIQNLAALLSYIVCAFVLLTHAQEFYRGTKVRRKITGENHLLALIRLSLKNRRRYGGYIIHMGIIFMAIGIIGSNFYNVETTRSVRAGEQIEIADYTLNFNKLSSRREGANEVVFADIDVYRNGSYYTNLQPEKIFYPTWHQPRTEVAIKGTLREDLYIILAGWDQDGTTALTVHVNPLVQWLWIGGYVLVLGTLFALWPGRGSELGPKYTKALTEQSEVK